MDSSCVFWYTTLFVNDAVDYNSYAFQETCYTLNQGSHFFQPMEPTNGENYITLYEETECDGDLVELLNCEWNDYNKMLLSPEIFGECTCYEANSVLFSNLPYPLATHVQCDGDFSISEIELDGSAITLKPNTECYVCSGPNCELEDYLYALTCDCDRTKCCRTLPLVQGRPVSAQVTVWNIPEDILCIEEIVYNTKHIPSFSHLVSFDYFLVRDNPDPASFPYYRLDQAEADLSASEFVNLYTDIDCTQFHLKQECAPIIALDLRRDITATGCYDMERCEMERGKQIEGDPIIIDTSTNRPVECCDLCFNTDHCVQWYRALSETCYLFDTVHIPIEGNGRHEFVGVRP